MQEPTSSYFPVSTIARQLRLQRIEDILNDFKITSKFHCSTVKKLGIIFRIGHSFLLIQQHYSPHPGFSQFAPADVRCWSFSPPGGLMSRNLSKAVQPFVTSVICGKDVVPRLSVVNIGRLIDQMVPQSLSLRPFTSWWLLTCSGLSILAREQDFEPKLYLDSLRMIRLCQKCTIELRYMPVVILYLSYTFVSACRGLFCLLILYGVSLACHLHCGKD